MTFQPRGFVEFLPLHPSIFRYIRACRFLGLIITLAAIGREYRHEPINSRALHSSAELKDPALTCARDKRQSVPNKLVVCCMKQQNFEASPTSCRSEWRPKRDRPRLEESATGLKPRHINDSTRDLQSGPLWSYGKWHLNVSSASINCRTSRFRLTIVG